MGPYSRYSQTMKMETADSETRRYISASLNCVTFQKTVIFIFISLRTSNVTSHRPNIDAAEHTAIERWIWYGDHELPSAVATQLKLGVTQIRRNSNYVNKYHSILLLIFQYTGRFIMFSVITNIYNKKTKGHVDACVARTWISYRCVLCHPWCTHRTFVVVKKKKSIFLWLWTIQLR